jgi:hypothetical protein
LLVLLGILAVALAFVAVGVLAHPFGNIAGGVLSCLGLLAVSKASGIYKRRQGDALAPSDLPFPT